MTDDEALAETRDFLSTYFHEDWVDEAADAEEVVERFLATNPKAERLRRLARGIETFTKTYENDRDLEAALFAELHCNYMPSADGSSSRAWLDLLKERFLTEACRLGNSVQV